jgi:CheY-like chemotaxis protein
MALPDGIRLMRVANRDKVSAVYCLQQGRFGEDVLMAPIKLLFVEDEMLLRMAIVPSLEESGYVVCQASNAKQALDLFNTAPKDFTCAIIDIGLPDMQGDKLCAALRQLSPGLPVILATGYGEAELRKTFAGDNRLRILGKPYFIDDLCGMLKDLGAAGFPAAPAPLPSRSTAS